MTPPDFPVGSRSGSGSGSGSGSDLQKMDTGFHKPDLIGRFAHHKVAANLLMIILLIAGAAALIKLNTQFLPKFALDYITVRVVWPGASAEDVSKSIITPLEQQLKNLDHVKEMTSVSSRGAGVITLQYDEGTDMGLALDQAKEYVDGVRNLPSNSERPVVNKIERNEDVATLILSTDGSLDELRPLAYQFERELLDRGVAKVEFTGLPEQEIAIQVPAAQIENLQQSLPQIGQRIVNQSQDIPAGTNGKNEVAKELRSTEQRRSAQDFENLAILTTESGARLTLGDIAQIDQRAKTGQVKVFHKGRPAVLMRILRTETADTLKSADVLHQWLDKTRPTLSQGLHLEAFNEAYILIEQRIDLLIKNGIGGLILVVGILFIFLNGRVATWVAWGIPVSFMGTLAVLYLAGGSINMVSLFALIMALGIIVDDAIVVGEDALTHYQMGENPLQAAEGGARRMFVPVVSSSLTTVAAFLPLMIIGGIIGNILKTIPLVIICVIITSLIESFLVLPGHLTHSFKRAHFRISGKARNADEAPGKFERIRLKLDNNFEHFRDNVFRPIATWAIHNRLSTILIAVGIFVFAITLIISGQVKFTFFPQPENQIVIASVKFSAGTPPETVQAFGREMERALQQTNEQLKQDKDLVVHRVLRINQATFNSGQSYTGGEQYASLHVELSSPDSRQVRNHTFIKAWKENLARPDGVEQLSITSPRGGPPGKDIDLFLYGPEPGVLKTAGERLADKLKEFAGVSNIQDDLPYGKDQYIYKLTPQGEALGLTVASVGQQLRAALDGQILQIFYDANEEVEVRILLPDAERNYARMLDSFPIVTPAGKTAALGNVVALEHRRGLEILRHTDGRIGIHVTAEVDTNQNNANEILATLEQQFLPQLTQQYGLNYELKGRAEEQRDTQADMKLGAQIGFALIYIILAWVFSSYVWPFAIMMAIPFGVSGAIIGHWVLGFDLSILSMFGIFGLSGIVVNDAIILVTFYRELREKGHPIKEAIIEASCLRLRAVILTSLTTIAGLLPLLFETSLQAQFLIPMAISISFGLLFSTLLVLIVIPSILSLIDGARVKFYYRLNAPQDAETPQ